MTTYAPTFTPRVKCHYRAAGIAHTCTVRGERGDSTSVMEARSRNLQEIFTLAAPVLSDDFEWTAVEIALTDSDSFFPATMLDPVTGTIDFGAIARRYAIVGTTFSGRGFAGKSRFTMYGLYWIQAATPQPGNDFVVTGAENAIITDIAANASAHFRDSSGGACSFYNQATIKENDQLVKKMRRGLIT